MKVSEPESHAASDAVLTERALSPQAKSAMKAAVLILQADGDSMKAIICSQWCELQDLVLGDLPDPVAGPGEVVIAIKAAALNFFDILMMQGKYRDQAAIPVFAGCGNLRRGRERRAGRHRPQGRRPRDLLGWPTTARARRLRRRLPRP